MQDFLDFWTFLRDMSSNAVLNTFLNCIMALPNLVVLSYKPLSYKKQLYGEEESLHCCAIPRKEN